MRAPRRWASTVVRTALERSPTMGGWSTRKVRSCASQRSMACWRSRRRPGYGRVTGCASCRTTPARSPTSPMATPRSETTSWSSGGPSTPAGRCADARRDACAAERAGAAGTGPARGSRSMRLPFTDRTEAGRLLGERLARMGLGADAVVLALPRGGVPVGYEVARALRAVLDVFVVRKLGVPGHEELAMGAIATGGVRVVNDSVTHVLGVPDHVIDRVAEEELRELERREAAYRGRRALPDVQGRDAILVDDGLATGATMRAAIQAVRVNEPARVIVAVPVAPWEACSELRSVADEMVCLETPEPFQAVGLWYSDFTPPTDDEIREMLARAGGPQR